MDIKEEDYRELFEKVLNLKVQELMQEPFDDDMIHDDFWSDETKPNYF